MANIRLAVKLSCATVNHPHELNSFSAPSFRTPGGLSLLSII